MNQSGCHCWRRRSCCARAGGGRSAASSIWRALRSSLSAEDRAARSAARAIVDRFVSTRLMEEGAIPMGLPYAIAEKSLRDIAENRVEELQVWKPYVATMGEEVAAVVAELMDHNTMLTTFDLSGVFLCPGAIRQVARIVRETRTLRALSICPGNMSDDAANDESVLELIDAFRVDESIEQLCIAVAPGSARNSVSFPNFARFIECAAHVRRMELRWMGLASDHEASLLAAALKRNRFLEAFKVQRTDGMRMGASPPLTLTDVVLEAFAAHPRLASVTLRGGNGEATALPAWLQRKLQWKPSRAVLIAAWAERRSVKSHQSGGAGGATALRGEELRGVWGGVPRAGLLEVLLQCEPRSTADDR